MSVGKVVCYGLLDFVGREKELVSDPAFFLRRFIYLIGDLFFMLSDISVGFVSISDIRKSYFIKHVFVLRSSPDASFCFDAYHNFYMMKSCFQNTIKISSTPFQKLFHL